MPEQDIKKIAEEILRIRLSQMLVNEEYKAGKFKVPVHLALGHESIAVSLDRVLGKEDSLILSHRNIAYNLARLGKLKPILSEYLLKPESMAGGKHGSMNLANPKKGIIYSSSILGNNFSVACGVAMSHKLSGTGGVTAVLGGDGSIEEGSFYESLLMMKSLGLAALVIIENNGWSLATRIEERRKPIDLEKYSDSMGVRYGKLSGNDPVKYMKELGELKKYALEKNEPVCIEVLVTTLGDWRGPKSEEYPEGKLINYHAGPAPAVLLSVWPLLQESEEDPVYALLSHFDKTSLKKMSSDIYKELHLEIS